jgi:hypothetical protein
MNIRNFSVFLYPTNLEIPRYQKADDSAVKWAQSSTRIWNSTVSLRSPFFKNSKWNKETYLDIWGQEIYIYIFIFTILHIIEKSDLGIIMKLYLGIVPISCKLHGFTMTKRHWVLNLFT